MIRRITKAYVRYYSDNETMKIYVEWINHRGESGRTEGDVGNLHMAALLQRAQQEDAPCTFEKW